MVNGAAVSWKVRKQTVVATSTQEAEYLALSLTAREGIWYRHIYDETNRSFGKDPIRILSDNLGATMMAKDAVFRSKTKHIDIAAHHIRDKVKKGRVKVDHVPGAENPADILTKALPNQACVKMLGMA